jgi:Flp pilus assembly secretin CpaC
MALRARTGGRKSIKYSIFLLAAVAGGLAGENAAIANEPISVVLDHAKVVRLPERANTVVVGNPLIADISMQSGGIIVVTGKGYGITNLIALDARGGMLMDQTIEVRGANEQVIVVQRGMERESYSCMPNCERRVALGDSPTYFDAVLGQTSRRDGQAQGAAAQPTTAR